MFMMALSMSNIAIRKVAGAGRSPRSLTRAARHDSAYGAVSPTLITGPKVLKNLSGQIVSSVSGIMDLARLRPMQLEHLARVSNYSG